MNQYRQEYRDIAEASQRARVGNLGMGLGSAFGTPGFAPNVDVLRRAGLSEEQIGIIMSLACNPGCCEPPENSVGQITLAGLPEDCLDPCECGHPIETTICAPATFMGLFVPSSIASCLTLTRLRVGCTDILINCHPIPMELFQCCEIDDNIFGGRTVAANSTVCLEVNNKCKAEIEFSGAVKLSVCLPC